MYLLYRLENLISLIILSLLNRDKGLLKPEAFKLNEA